MAYSENETINQATNQKHSSPVFSLASMISSLLKEIST